MLASVLLASVCVRFGFGCLDGAHTKNQHCIQSNPLSIQFYDFLTSTPLSAPACCLRPFCLPLFASVLALGALMGGHTKNQHCIQPPPLSIQFYDFLPLTPMSAPACCWRPFCCLRKFCLPLFASVLALGALMGPTQKTSIASNHPP
jgi:hypothetical protein